MLFERLGIKISSPRWSRWSPKIGARSPMRSMCVWLEAGRNELALARR